MLDLHLPVPTLSIRALAAPTLLLVLAAGCSTVTAKRAFEGPMVLPCDATTHYVFRPGSASLVSADGSEQSFPLAGVEGPPACVAWDYLEGYGVAAYRQGLARITLEDRVAPVVLAAEPWAAVPASIGMAGGLLCALSGSGEATLEVRRVEDGRRLWVSALDNWMDYHDLDVLALALPVEPYDGDHFLLVGSSRDRVVVQKVDRSRRPWTEEARTEFGELHRLQAWTSDGSDVYLAGVHEHVAGASHMSMGTLEQQLLVYRFDVSSLTKRELLRRESDAVETRVDALSVAGDLAALTLNDSQVEVYRIDVDALRRPAVDRPNFPYRVQAICTSADTVLVTGDGPSVVRTYRH